MTSTTDGGSLAVTLGGAVAGEPRSGTRGVPLLRPFQASADVSKSNKAAQLCPAPSRSSGASPDVAI
jgi:hypothetical protein